MIKTTNIPEHDTTTLHVDAYMKVSTVKMSSSVSSHQTCSNIQIKVKELIIFIFCFISCIWSRILRARIFYSIKNVVSNIILMSKKEILTSVFIYFFVYSLIFI